MNVLKDDIYENIEVSDKNDNGYKTVTLLRHDSIDCSSLSKEEFIRLFSDDYYKAISISNHLLDNEYEQSKEKRVEKIKNDAEKYANSHYKRESNRKKYVNNAIAKELASERGHWNNIDTFDFDLKFGTDNGIKNEWIIRKNKYSDTLESLDKVYDYLNDEKNYANSFWKDASGWSFNYTAYKNSYNKCFRPWIDLILPAKKVEEIIQNKERLKREISDFYSKSNYWGD